MKDRTKKSLGEIISRIAMAMAAAAMIYGGIQCIRFSWAISDEYHKENPHVHHVRASDRPGYLPMLGGLALILTGGFCAIGAAVPVSVLERLYNSTKD